MFDPEPEQLEAKISELQAIVEAQAALIAELRSRIEELEARLGKYSSNSSLPPSRDRTDRRARRAAEAKERRGANKALGKAARRSGKQPGAPGATLARRTPDRGSARAAGRPWRMPWWSGRPSARCWRSPSPAWRPSTMSWCASAAPADARPGGSSRPRQPARCAGGHGPKATGAYLRPPAPASGARRRGYGRPVCPPHGRGHPGRAAPRGRRGAPALHGQDRRSVADLPVVHADQTSVRIGVGLGWVHTVASRSYTHLAVHEQRGIDGIVAIGVLAGYTNTIVHDGLATYDCSELASAIHAQCNQHLSRTLGDLATHSSQTPGPAP